jgi:hypothetical protein
MNNPIEEAERTQLKHWRTLLIAFYLAIALLIVRYLFGTVFSEHGLNMRPVGTVILVATVLLLAVVLYQNVKLARLMVRSKSDPLLREALIDSELAKLHLLESWRVGFIAAVATPFFFLLVSTIYPLNDPVLVALATAIAGSGAFLTSFYLKSTG